MGAGLSFVSGFLEVLGEARGARAATQTAVSGDGEFPIGLWWPPPPAQTTVERYREISDAGFNFVIGGNGVTNDAINPTALEAAAANDLRFLLTDGKLQNIICNSTVGARTFEAAAPSIMRFLLGQDEPRPDIRAAAEPRAEVRQRIQHLLELYRENPALAGLNLFDEPGRSLFGILGFAGQTLQEQAGEELPYVNVWPSYTAPSALETSSYREYLERYLGVVRPPLLSFDHYPLLSEGRITGDYFYNWAEIRRFSLRFGVPSWIFIQSVGFDGSKSGLPKRRRPDEAELLWQANVSLAYGAKGIQYFTYWTPDVPSDAPIRFGTALLSVDGRRTPLYDYAGRVNRYLSVVGKALLPLTSASVTHARERRLPRGAEAFRGDSYVRAVDGSPAILSRFWNPAGGTARYLFVVNRSFAGIARIRLTFTRRVRGVFRLESGTGEFARVPLEDRVLRLKIPPGGARLFRLRTG